MLTFSIHFTIFDRRGLITWFQPLKLIVMFMVFLCASYRKQEPLHLCKGSCAIVVSIAMVFLVNCTVGVLNSAPMRLPLLLVLPQPCLIVHPIIARINWLCTLIGKIIVSLLALTDFVSGRLAGIVLLPTQLPCKHIGGLVSVNSRS
jgi:hypothetical protein